MAHNPLGTPKMMVATDYNKLERVLREHFPGIDPDLIAREEWDNYEEHSFTVTGSLDAEATKTLADYIAGTWTRWGTTQVLLDALCLKGIIDPGDYVLDVSW